MMKHKKMILPGQEIEIKLSLRERDLIRDHTFADEELTDRLELALMDGDRIVVRYSLDDLDELLGFIAVEANHAKDKKLQKELEALYDRLVEIEESYEQEEE